MKRASVQPSWTPGSVLAARPDWLSAIDGLWPAVQAKVGTKIGEREAGASADAVRAAYDAVMANAAAVSPPPTTTTSLPL